MPTEPLECTECTLPNGEHERKCPYYCTCDRPYGLHEISCVSYVKPAWSDAEISEEITRQQTIITDLKDKLRKLELSRFDSIITPDMSVSVATNKTLARDMSQNILFRIHQSNPDAVMVMYERAIEMMATCNSLMDLAAAKAKYEKRHAAQHDAVRKMRSEPTNADKRAAATKERVERVATSKKLTARDRLFATLKQQQPKVADEKLWKKVDAMMKVSVGDDD